MKKCLLAGTLIFALFAQAQKPTVKPKPKTPVVQSHPLKNMDDSVSYAIGLMVANFYHQQGIKNLNSALVAKAVSDVYANKKSLMNETEANTTLMRCMNPNLSKNLAEGEKFLQENQKKPGVKTTPSGLQYQVITEGTGPRPAVTDTVTVNYAGTLLNGTSFDKNNGISFSLNGVIPGWTEGLQLMPTGSKYRLWIPYKLAYGMNDNGPIPGGSTLVFEVELVSIKGK